MEDLFERFTVSILRLNKLVQRIKIYEIKKFGLKSIHVMCLYYLNCHPEGLTASELVKLTLEDKAAISRALATMREEGYAEYDSATHNADVRLTPKGKQLAEYIVGRAAAAVSAGSADFSAEQREFFYKSLVTISDNLEQYYNELSKK
ncbi:MAG TPA: MarR family transcriptional regulator [Candidatus Coproplasma avicola]|uniref:MarR family transcriptional regulator n=1 Tax=Candidatus Coproplasma avicola TaxID=2840744 RepID=A0A9D1E7U2_9FIRM|nr:MarR family transcriptional regulator [Candidatus Coproplasma avicola]